MAQGGHVSGDGLTRANSLWRKVPFRGGAPPSPLPENKVEQYSLCYYGASPGNVQVTKPLPENNLEQYLVATRIARPPDSKAKGGTDNLQSQTTYHAASSKELDIPDLG